MTREEVESLKAAANAADIAATVAKNQYLESLIEYRYSLPPDEREAELRREVDSGADYVTAWYAREVLKRLDELRQKGGAK